MPSPALVKRRPFLVPIGLLLAAAAAAACVLALATWWLVTAPSLQVVVIPASTVVGAERPARDIASRASALARMWGDARSPGHIEAIYVGNGPAERALAAPIAARLGLVPIGISDDGAGLARRVLEEHTAERVLIVVSAERVAALIMGLSGDSLPGSVGSDELVVVAIPRFGRATYLRLSYEAAPSG